MTLTSATILNGTTGLSALGNVYGVPSMPAPPRFVHRAKISADYVSLNRGRLARVGSAGSAVFSGSGAMDFDAVDGALRMTQSQGLTTPYLVPSGSFTWAFVMRRGATSPQIAPLMGNRRGSDGLMGMAVYTSGTGLGRDVRVGYAVWDGSNVGSVAAITYDATDYIREDGEWRMVFVRYDSESAEFSTISPDTAGKVSSALSSGTALYMPWRSDYPIILGGDYYSNLASNTNDWALFMGWEVALTDAQIRAQVYPGIRAWLAADGIDLP